MQPIVIEIVPYKPSWVEEFDALGKRLREQLANPLWRIDHIGSTAVPGLAAKNRIDMQISVLSADDFIEARELLEQVGYEELARIRGDHIPPGGPHAPEQWEKRYFRAPTNQRPTNLHVRIQGRANQRYALLFRDYLRANSEVASIYAAIKKRISEYHRHDSASYSDIKDPSCDLIMHGANAWAKQVDWRPDLSDA